MGDAGLFESETRESRCGICKRENHRRGNSRRGVRVARMADAGIADAGFASQECHNARSAFKSGCEENADADVGSASR